MTPAEPKGMGEREHQGLATEMRTEERPPRDTSIDELLSFGTDAPPSSGENPYACVALHAPALRAPRLPNLRRCA